MSYDVLPAPDRIERFCGELIAYVRSLFPMRFYHGEKWWAVDAAAALLRLADMADSVLAHMHARRDQDAQAALRHMYEMAITLCWILADPDPRRRMWKHEAGKQQLKIHHDAAEFGERLLSEHQVATLERFLEENEPLPPLAERALRADADWSSRITGLHAPEHLLGFRGLYIGVYRLGSQVAHASILTLEPYVERDAKPIAVNMADPDSLLVYALVSPLLAMTVSVVASQVEWIDEARVRAINAEACTSGGL